MTVFACSIDDPTDGAGVGDATFCADPGHDRPPGSRRPRLPPRRSTCSASPSPPAASLLQTVCGAIGTGTILSQLTAAVSPVAPLSVCPAGARAARSAFDSQPDDLRRVRIDVSWNRGGAGSVSQTTLLTNPRQT